MQRFVLDNSVVMRWLFNDGGASDLAYAKRVLDLLGEADSQAVAPPLWPVEAANVIARAESKGLLVESRSSEFIGLLDALGVELDAITFQQAFRDILQIARRFTLSAYDATYLELALREGLPLATLDAELQEAATIAGVGSV